MLSSGSHLDSTLRWPKANTPEYRGAIAVWFCGMSFEKHVFWRDDREASPLQVSHTRHHLPVRPYPQHSSSQGALVTEVLTPGIRMVSSLQRLNVSLQRWGRLCLWEIFTFLATSKFGLPGSLLEVTRNSLTICWKNFPALAPPEDFWMKCIFTGVTADTGLAFNDTENRHKKWK